jgi:hypothetical protein
MTLTIFLTIVLTVAYLLAGVGFDKLERNYGEYQRASDFFSIIFWPIGLIVYAFIIK